MLCGFWQVVLKFMYFPACSLWRNGKETSRVSFVRTYSNDVCPNDWHVSLLHCIVRTSKFVLFIWIDTSIPSKSQSIVRVRFTRFWSQNPSLIPLEFVKPAATTTQIQGNKKKKIKINWTYIKWEWVQDLY